MINKQNNLIYVLIWIIYGLVCINLGKDLFSTEKIQIQVIEIPVDTVSYELPKMGVASIIDIKEVLRADVLNKKIEPQQLNYSFDILKPCGYTKEELISCLNTENHQQFIPYVDSFIKAEENYGVNALYLMCKMGYESGWGRHMCGNNNIGGWSDNNGGWADFDSVDACVMQIAKCLSTTYKDAVGTNIVNVSRRYCPEQGYVDELLLIMQQRTDVINEGRI